MLLIAHNSTLLIEDMATIDRQQVISRLFIEGLDQKDVQAHLVRDMPEVLMGELKKKYTASPHLRLKLTSPLPSPTMI